MDVRPRLCILTDIGGDPDDQQSLVRLLVYANEFDIEAIIPQHWDGETHGRNGRTPEQQMELVRDYIHRYGMVHANLSQHAAGYPSADRLEAVVKRGMVYVPAADDGGNVDPESIVGEGKDTEGSR